MSADFVEPGNRRPRVPDEDAIRLEAHLPAEVGGGRDHLDRDMAGTNTKPGAGETKE